MGLRQAECNLALTVYCDDARTDQDAALEDVMRALSEADQAGIFDRRGIDFTYGDVLAVSNTPAPPGTETAIGSVRDKDD